MFGDSEVPGQWPPIRPAARPSARDPKRAFMKLPLVRVCPQEQEKTSATPAKFIIFFSVMEPTTPLPRGAGMRRTRTEPHFPCTWSAGEGGGGWGRENAAQLLHEVRRGR